MTPEIPRRRLVVVAVVSFLTLALQLHLTRILSFVFWNHVVYLIISIALLGYGVSGTYLATRRRPIEKSREESFLGFNLMMVGLSVLAGLVLLRMPSLDALAPLGRASAGSPGSLLLLLVAYTVFVLPFFFAGNCIVFLFSVHSSHSNRLYLFDLVAAAAGCVLFPLTLRLAGAVGGVLSCVLIALATAAWYLWTGPATKATRALLATTAVGAVAVAATFAFRAELFPLSVAPGKVLAVALRNPGARIEHSSWDVVTRVDFVAREGADLDLGWTRILPGDRLVTFDGDAISHLPRRANDFPSRADIEGFAKTGLPALVPEARGGDHLIIGMGGGPDISTSMLFGAKSITVVEINGALLRALTTKYADLGGRVTLRDNVRLVHSEGRSFLQGEARRYDFIHMSGTDTFAALSTGAYTLAENFLYTKEAVRAYYDHLSDDGCMLVLRWFFSGRPRESLRYFATVLEALRDAGAEHPEAHVVVVRAGVWRPGDARRTPEQGTFSPGLTVLYKRPLSEAQARAKLAAISAAAGLAPVFVPLPSAEWRPAAVPEAEYFDVLARAIAERHERRFYERYLYNVEPVVDDRPFFFNYYKLSTLLAYGSRAVGSTGPVQGYWAYLVFAVVLLSALAAVGAFIFLPLLRFRREGLAARGSALACTYFTCLGLGFVMLEVALMQKLALLLGHPMYSIATVLASLLLSAGLGSAWSARWKETPSRGVSWALLALICTSVGFVTLGSSVVAVLLGWSLPVRVLATVALVAPIGLSLGCFFPLGLLSVRRHAAALVPWAWGVNSGFTVVGSVGAVALAMMLGFTAVILAALLCYCVGVLAFLRYESVPATPPAAVGGSLE